MPGTGTVFQILQALRPHRPLLSPFLLPEGCPSALTWGNQVFPGPCWPISSGQTARAVEGGLRVPARRGGGMVSFPLTHRPSRSLLSSCLHMPSAKASLAWI